MFIELDGEGPRYAQLARGLKKAIQRGQLKAGSRLPATRTLAADLQLSRNTVLAAYETLCAERLALPMKGSGTYVAAEAPAAPLAPAAPGFPAQTRFAARLRALPRLALPVGQRRARYDLRYGESLIHPLLPGAWRRAMARATAADHWPHPLVAGLPALRRGIADYLARRRGVVCHADDVVVVGGAQQAVSLLARILLDEGDPVAVEDPGYPLAVHALLAHGAKLVPIPVDRDGLRIGDLAGRPIRAVYVTPSHQFPSGAVMSVERRQALLEHARAEGCWVLEDDYDGEFRHDASSIPALRSLDESGRVVYIGTFSKALFPGLRLGYVVCPPALRGDLLLAKRCDDLACSVMEQAALAELMADGGFDRHLRRVAGELRRRRRALLEGLRRHCARHLQWQDSRAGMHVVAWLDGWSSQALQALVDLALERHLGIHPIGPHYLAAPARPGLLLGYAGLSVSQLEVATRLLGTCLADASRMQATDGEVPAVHQAPALGAVATSNRHEPRRSPPLTRRASSRRRAT
jgi:GntR family transcriptional regulator/MocR family aminotransferase